MKGVRILKQLQADDEGLLTQEFGRIYYGRVESRIVALRKSYVKVHLFIE